MNNEQNENPMMKNSNYRRLLGNKNKLIKRLNFAEQRIEKYGFALSDEEYQRLQQRIAATSEELAEVNDKLSDLEDGLAVDGNATGADEAIGGDAAAIPQKWVGKASQALKDASRAESQAAFAASQAKRR